MINEIIEKLDLQTHPEGGYFKEVYRSNGTIPKTVLGNNYSGPRNYATSIYFLLTSDNFSAFHKINQDETWHFYKGSPLKLHIIDKKGNYQYHLIGNDIANNQIPQFTVSGGDWFAAEVAEPNSYSFVGCTVAPGFEFDDFVLPRRDELIELFPQHSAIIQQLTR